MNSNPSQADKILCALETAHGGLVAMPLLSHISGAYAVHSRIAELRKRGHNIPPATIDHDPVSNAKHSFYRLVPGGAP